MLVLFAGPSRRMECIGTVGRRASVEARKNPPEPYWAPAGNGGGTVEAIGAVGRPCSVLESSQVPAYGRDVAGSPFAGAPAILEGISHFAQSGVLIRAWYLCWIFSPDHPGTWSLSAGGKASKRARPRKYRQAPAGTGGHGRARSGTVRRGGHGEARRASAGTVRHKRTRRTR